VFTARYALSPYIKQICFVFKGLVGGGISMGLKRAGREAENSPLSQTEDLNEWNYTSSSS
jgi:hypothetical protein